MLQRAAGGRVQVWGRQALASWRREIANLDDGALDNELEEALSARQPTKTKRDRKMRFLVMQQTPQATKEALALLEQSVFRTPVVDAGGATKFLKLPPASVCNKVISASAQEPDLVPKAAELADALALQGVGLEGRTLQNLLAGMARQARRGAGLVGEALPLLDMWLQQQAEALSRDDERATRAPLAVLTALLEAAARAESAALVLQVLARMASVGLVPTSQSTTSLLQCFARMGQHATALGVLDWMKRSGLDPGVQAYTALLTPPAHLSEAGAAALVAHAKATYARLLDDGVPPNARFFTALLHCYGRGRDAGAVERAWTDLRARHGLRPDLILYSAMIDACAKCRNGEAALAAYEEMRAAGVTPDVVAYTALLSALHGAPDASARARGLWDGMRQAGVRPNGRAVAAYLDLLLSVGETDEALALLTDAAALLGMGRRTNGAGGGASSGGDGGRAPAPAPALAAAAPVIDLPRIYEHFIHVLAGRGQFAQVEHLARHRKAARLPQTVGIASALLTARALAAGRPATRWLLQQEEWPAEGSLEERASIRARRAAAVALPDAVVEACLLGRGDAAALARQLLECGELPEGGGGSGGRQPLSGTAANVLIGGLGVQGQAEEAFAVFDWMQRDHRRQLGPRPDWWTHRLLLYAALNAREESARLDLTLRALAAARRHSHEACSRGGSAGLGWDQKTRRAVLAALQQGERGAALLAGASASGDEHDQKVARLRALLSLKG